MNIQDFVNEIFRIENEVSAPILITLLVFILGGVIKLIFNQIRLDVQRSNYRKNFRSILNEIIKDCAIRENSTYNLLPHLNSNHLSYWPLDYIKIRYISTFFALPFEKVFDSFQSKIKWRYNQKLKRKAFHDVYSTLENLNYFDALVYPEFKEFIKDLNRYHEKYNDSISHFTYLRDQLAHELKGNNFIKGAGVLDNYIIKVDKIWKEWLKLDEKERVHYKSTYDYIVKPTLDLNRKTTDLAFTLEQNKYLLECSAYYNEMENILLRARLTFKNHYLGYRLSRRTLNKCLEIL